MPDPEATLSKLPRLPSDAEIVERLRRWAREFDSIDAQCYTAQEFIDWVELEHNPPVRVALHPESDVPSYPVWTDAVAL